LIGFLCHLIQDRTMVSWGLGEHVLQKLFISLCNYLFHTSHVLPVRLHQTVEVVCDTMKYQPCLAAEVGFESCLEPLESRHNTINFIDASIR